MALNYKRGKRNYLRIKEISFRLSPNRLGYLSDQVKLSPLLCLRQLVAYLARGEATLRTETQTLQRHILGSLVDASDDRSLVLQDWRLTGNQTEHHLLVIRHILQRLETARTLIVKLQIEGIHVLMGKEIRSHWVVSTLGGIARMIVATAYILSSILRKSVAEICPSANFTLASFNSAGRK